MFYQWQREMDSSFHRGDGRRPREMAIEGESWGVQNQPGGGEINWLIEETKSKGKGL